MPDSNLILEALPSPYRAQVKNGANTKTLWFEFEPLGSDASAPELSHKPTSTLLSFAVALIPYLWTSRRSLHIAGLLPEHEWSALNRYASAYSYLRRAFGPPISLKCDVVLRDPNVALLDGSKPPLKRIGTAFSGGVDSLHAWLTLLKQSQRGSHQASTRCIYPEGLYMQGFDTPLSLKYSLRDFKQKFSEEAQRRNSQGRLWLGATNLRYWINTAGWDQGHGAALLAAALFFRGHWEEFWVPSSYTHGTHPIWGSHPDVDPSLSFSNFKITYFAPQLNRYQKLKEMTSATQEFPWDCFRVCWNQSLGVRNCGKCEKCIRTLLCLELLRSRRQAVTFPRMSLAKLLRRTGGLALRTSAARIFAREVLFQAVLCGRFDIGLALLVAFGRRACRRATRVLGF